MSENQPGSKPMRSKMRSKQPKKRRISTHWEFQLNHLELFCL